MVDKRSHARFTASLDVTLIYQEQRYSAHSRDVSLGGMFVYTDAPIPFGASVYVEFSLPSLKSARCIEATARWHQEGGVGLSWKSLRAQEVWALNQLFKHSA